MASLLAIRSIIEKRNEISSETDLSIISITWGFTLGFGFLTTWTAMKQTRHMWKRRNGHLNHPYIWMVWAELVSSLALSIVCWLVLQGPLTLNVYSLFSILSLWVIQVHCLFQIIINRVSILMVNRRRASQLKIGTFVGILLVNISVFCIWIPAKLEVNDTYEKLNVVWDRIEKVIILIVDALLNGYFIRVVRQQLIKPGLTKYQPLVRFNLWMIMLSLAMDCLIIGMLSLKNPLVYLMYVEPSQECFQEASTDLCISIVKLKIEMSMAELIAHVARTQDMGPVRFNNPESSNGTINAKGYTFNTTTSQSKRGSVQKAPASPEDVELGNVRPSSPEAMQNHFGIIEEEETMHDDHHIEDGFVVHRHNEITVEVESAPSERSEKTDGQGENFDSRRHTSDSDEAPLRKPTNTMGVNTKVWGRY
ncbi:hypothetical protein E4T38_08247 [Aureobasidium subglaciale]|nr:hypothetical protein E4T38_08247 [Aureobasidium subglaciale]KAI5215703.1 hypothetical protein E4T40_08257 [Aureobasidium subglaciale]KAI5218896.1 hypothetical protein E4T41_08172 [Aureobasidium subglaciale]KAI5256540.1 hypothetical protein E4T46_08148 [Aureobasidium subglaciale]